MAKKTLEATAQLQGLSDCLDYLTPEWLQSLILDGKSVAAPRDVAASVRECPERCLELLQVCNCRYIQLQHSACLLSVVVYATPKLTRVFTELVFTAGYIHMAILYFREHKWGKETDERDRKLRTF